MNHTKFSQIIIGLIFIPAIIFGFLQNHSSLFGSKKIIQVFPPANDSLQNYLIRGQELAGQNKPASTTVTFLAVGDIMLSRNVALEMEKHKDNLYPFARMTEIFNPPSGSASFNFGNLESPVAPDQEIVGGHSLVFGADAASLVGLEKYNFKILNLANNHALDQGFKGVTYTKEVLDYFKIAHVGTGENLGQAWEPAIVSAGGIKVCFIGASYSSINDSGATKNDYVARMDNPDYLQAAIKTAKQECDFTVVTMHAGTEYTRTPNKMQTTFAHTAIDLGADIVIGAHPHWVQTMEKYCPSSTSLPSSASDEGRVREGSQSADGTQCSNPKYIFYSLGNFIFDQNFSQDTKEGLTLKITISKANTSSPISPNAATADDLQGQRNFASLDKIELVPVIIDNSQPRPANEDETKKILEKIGQTGTILK